MNEYTVIISKEIIYETKIHADNWEDACDLAEQQFHESERDFVEVDRNWEVVDYALISGEEKSEEEEEEEEA